MSISGSRDHRKLLCFPGSRRELDGEEKSVQERATESRGNLTRPRANRLCCRRQSVNLNPGCARVFSHQHFHRQVTVELAEVSREELNRVD